VLHAQPFSTNSTRGNGISDFVLLCTLVAFHNFPSY
jgi:hypothetical protein